MFTYANDRVCTIDKFLQPAQKTFSFPGGFGIVVQVVQVVHRQYNQDPLIAERKVMTLLVSGVPERIVFE